MNKTYGESIPKGAKIIFDKQDKWNCEFGCKTVLCFIELKTGEYWLTRCCTIDLTHTMKRIEKDYINLIPNIVQPFTFLAYG